MLWLIRSMCLFSVGKLLYVYIVCYYFACILYIYAGWGRHGPLLGRGMGRSVAVQDVLYMRADSQYAFVQCRQIAVCLLHLLYFSRDLLPRGFLVYFYILLVVVWPTPGSRHGTLSSCRMWCICMVSRKQTKYTRCDAPMCLYCIQIGI